MDVADYYNKDGTSRNEYYTLLRNPDITYILISDVYVISYNFDGDYYSYAFDQCTVLVDTVFVKDILNFEWKRMKTNHGDYFIGKPRNEDGVNFLKRIGRHSVELHTMIALLASVPNPNRYEFVDHITYSKDCRVANLTWSATKPYRIMNGESLQYPGMKEHPEIRWKVSNVMENGQAVQKSFFSVSHPRMRSKSWYTSRSSNLTQEQKFEQAKKKVYELERLDEQECPLKAAYHDMWEGIYELIDEYDESVSNSM